MRPLPSGNASVHFPAGSSYVSLKAASALGVHPTECAIVGDTEVDVRAGKAAGARTVGVTWGYGTRARLEDAGVDYLIETPDALPALLRALTPSTAA